MAVRYDAEMKTLLDGHAPLISKTVRDRKKVAWFDTHAKDLQRIARKFEKIWKKTNSSKDLEKVKEARKEYRQYLKNRKQTHFIEAIQIAKGNSRQLFAVTDGLMGESTNKSIA